MTENNKVIGGGAQLFDQLAKYNKFLFLPKCSRFF